MLDILLSFPIFSFFFSSTNSLSTSLNLLFFYVTWSSLILAHKPLNIQVYGTLAIRVLAFLLPSLVFLLFDTLLPSLAVSIKHGGSSALPPRNVSILARTTLLAVFNILLATAIEAGASYGLSYLSVALKSPTMSPFTSSTTLPLPFAIVKQLGLLYLSRELLTYYIHRAILHSHVPNWMRRLPFRSTSSASRRTKKATSRIARQHASYAHHRSAPPFALLAAADHPLPFLLMRSAPMFLPAALIIHPHLLVYFLFLLLTTFEDTMTMSGYTIVPGIIMGGIARRNAAHYGAGHCGSGSGNYGAWGLLDWMGGTGLGGSGTDLKEDVRDEAIKHRVRERSTRKAGEVGDAVKGGIDGMRKGRGKGRRRGSDD
ncbi:hypothetical protein BD289DRAFT_449035 [Coniella lustricola]|uniref:Fatty acid hydroxylase domain-containing protein n=1 Tax=Coniella lustricola TaxID=2025994 RepID=A0A2T3ANL1_9PEZI|nr:hypothetical protein BD289DRAFT_449035 [Coniella lustricola]